MSGVPDRPDLPATPSLPDKIVALDEALDAVPHAFGGALALAYYADPRATVDIDINVFVPTVDPDPVLGPLRLLGADLSVDVDVVIGRDGQVRIGWLGTPIDLFFSYDPFHDAARDARRRVSFAAGTIPILSAEHLTVCKVVFDRGKDWVDIDAMIDAGTVLDAAEVVRWVGRIAGDTDPRYTRIVARLTS